MKELRYMRKKYATTDHAGFGADADPLSFEWQENRGFDNGMGWELSGFIEDQNGSLRPQSKHETSYCLACHADPQGNFDQTFSFARKIDGVKGWSYIDIDGMKDVPRQLATGEDKLGEIATYMTQVSGEFRENNELLSQFLEQNGRNSVSSLRNKTIDQLILPSPAQARKLNKAYLSIVLTQSFVFGRDSNIRPVQNIYSSINPTDIEVNKEFSKRERDLRLIW